MNKTGVILSGIREKKTIDAIGKELDMRETTIRAIVDSLVHNGYLEEMSCGGGCSMCPASCSLPSSSGIRAYIITRKGMKYVKKPVQGVN